MQVEGFVWDQQMEFSSWACSAPYGILVRFFIHIFILQKSIQLYNDKERQLLRSIVRIMRCYSLTYTYDPVSKKNDYVFEPYGLISLISYNLMNFVNKTV